MKLLVSILFLTIFSTSLFAEQVPDYKDYPVVADFQGKPAAPVLDTPEARMMRTQLRQQAATGPNFAGHFTLARWGCGAGCASWAIIDARSGKVWFAPFQVSDATVPDNPELRQYSIDFKIDSELIVANGALNGEGAGTYYYRWHNGSLTLIYSREYQTSTDQDDDSEFIDIIQKTKASVLEKGLPDIIIPQWLENMFQFGRNTTWEVNDCAEGGDGRASPVCVEMKVPQQNGYYLHISCVVGDTAGRKIDKPRLMTVYFYKSEGYKTLDVINVKTIAEAIQLYKTDLGVREK